MKPSFFSKRSDWDMRPNRLSRVLAARKAEGKPLIDLTVSNPTTAGFDYIDRDILSALTLPAALTYAPDPRGIPEARQAVAAYYRERGAAVDPAHIFLTAGTSEAYTLLFKILADPGDEILIPRPGYPLLPYLAALESLRPVYYPLRYGDHSGWRVDLEILSALITPGTKAVVAVSPGNPTGAYLKPDEQEYLSRLSRNGGPALIVDEVFFDFPGRKEPPRISTAASDHDGLTFVLNGFSKMLGLPQMKLGWIAAAGDPALKRAAADRLELVNDFFLSASGPVQHAAGELLQRGGGVRAEITARLEDNFRFLEESAGSLPERRVLIREGGWYAVVEILDDLTDEERSVALLESCGVFAHPGYFYDFDRDGCLVVSLLTPPDPFRSGVRRIFSDE